MTTQDQPQRLTGGSSNYYKIELPSVGTIDLLDVIEALQLNFNEGNIFKAVMRRAMNRVGKGKQGTTSTYDAEKIVFFGQRELAREEQPSTVPYPDYDKCNCGVDVDEMHYSDCMIFRLPRSA